MISSEQAFWELLIGPTEMLLVGPAANVLMYLAL